MRALVVTGTTGPEGAELAEVPEPAGAHPMADGERLLVEVKAAAVSFPDVLQSRAAYQHGVPPPYVAGGEYAGVVLEAPASSRFRTGDRVAGFSMWGGIAERAVGIPRYTVRIPESMGWAEGAAFFLNYATAWFTLHRAAFVDGEAVLVHGAAGGVGTAALDLLRGRARPSIAVVSSEEKADVARACGADHVLRSDREWLDGVRSVAPQGVAVVVDPVGGDRMTDSLRALDVGGRLMVVGFASGSIPEVRVNRLLLRDLSLVGVALDPWERRFPGYATELTEGLEQAVATGRVRPVVGHRLPLDRAHEALEIVDTRRALGKVVVEIAD